MVISFLVNPVHGGWEPTDKFLAGTEDSVVNWANELRGRGHIVRVYRNGHGKLEHNGVLYKEREDYRPGADITINIKSSEITPLEPTLYLTNEFNASELDLSAYKGVIWPSKWAQENISVNNQTFILPHGYDPAQIYPEEKIDKQCFYASSPDRGLSTLLSVWPYVIEAHPDASLILTYGVKGVNLPNVMSLGDCDEETMGEIYRTSDLWLHPCSGGELYCMVGKKAQVSGCIPVIIPRGALIETVKGGFKAKDETDYLEILLSVLDRSQNERELLRPGIIKEADAYTWQESTDKLEEIIESVLK